NCASSDGSALRSISIPSRRQSNSSIDCRLVSSKARNRLTCVSVMRENKMRYVPGRRDLFSGGYRKVSGRTADHADGNCRRRGGQDQDGKPQKVAGGTARYNQKRGPGRKTRHHSAPDAAVGAGT